MDYNLKQTYLEINRERFIEILMQDNLTPYDAIIIATEQWFIGIPFNEESTYEKEFRDHFEHRILKHPNYRGPEEYRYSYAMTEILEHLLNHQIEDQFHQIKKIVYDYLDEQKTLSDNKEDCFFWSVDADIPFTLYTCYVAEELSDLIGIKYDWTTEKKKTNKKK